MCSEQHSFEAAIQLNDVLLQELHKTREDKKTEREQFEKEINDLKSRIQGSQHRILWDQRPIQRDEDDEHSDKNYLEGFKAMFKSFQEKEADNRRRIKKEAKEKEKLEQAKRQTIFQDILLNKSLSCNPDYNFSNVENKDDSNPSLDNHQMEQSEVEKKEKFEKLIKRCDRTAKRMKRMTEDEKLIEIMKPYYRKNILETHTSKEERILLVKLGKKIVNEKFLSEETKKIYMELNQLMTKSSLNRLMESRNEENGCQKFGPTQELLVYMLKSSLGNQKYEDEQSTVGKEPENLKVEKLKEEKKLREVVEDLSEMHVEEDVEDVDHRMINLQKEVDRLKNELNNKNRELKEQSEYFNERIGNIQTERDQLEKNCETEMNESLSLIAKIFEMEQERRDLLDDHEDEKKNLELDKRDMQKIFDKQINSQMEKDKKEKEKLEEQIENLKASDTIKQSYISELEKKCKDLENEGNELKKMIPTGDSSIMSTIMNFAKNFQPVNNDILEDLDLDEDMEDDDEDVTSEEYSDDDKEEEKEEDETQMQE